MPEHHGQQRREHRVRQRSEGCGHGGFAAQSTKYNGSIKQENPLRYNGDGSAPAGLSAANGGPQLPQTPTVPAYTAADQATYSAVHPAGTAPEAQILSTEDPSAPFWSAGIPGFSVGGIQDDNIVENPYPATTAASITSTPVIQHLGGTSLQIGSEAALTGGMTTTAAASAAGDTTVTAAAVTNLVAGQPIMVDTGQNLEVGQITSIDTTAKTVTLTAPLQFAHASGVPFRVNEGQPVGMTGDSVEHLNMWASGAPHGVDDESQPTEELIRALELPATYTALLVSN